METKKIVIHCTTNQVGTDSYEFYEVPTDIPDKELSDLAYDCAKDNAEMYGIYPAWEYENDPDADLEDTDTYSEDVSGHVMDYSSDAHDCYTMSGRPDWQQYA